MVGHMTLTETPTETVSAKAAPTDERTLDNISLAEIAQADWHALSVDAALNRLAVDGKRGLNRTEVDERHVKFGYNELKEQPIKSAWAILWEQLTNPLVLLLIAAAIVSALLGKVIELIAIIAIVVLNAVLGVVQEYRAEKAMSELKKMAAPLVRVRRDGQLVDIPARELVPGDIVLLEAGSIVPADARVIESANLRLEEASLTGESEPVNKSIQAIADKNAPLGDRHNMVYLGTSVTYGRGTAVVVKTGMETELGRIAELIQSVETEKTPLQRRIAELGRVLIIAALVVMGISFGIGLLTEMALEDVLLNAVAIAVAVVPEGLPAVITVALALGAQRMLRRNALIRSLPAVETLGSVTTICSDKTGTLTENKMTVTVIDVAGNTSEFSEVDADSLIALSRMNGDARESTLGAQAMVLAGSILCTDVVIESEGQGYKAIGDPTETALAIAGTRLGLYKFDLDNTLPRVDELPFDSDRKRMTTVHQMASSSDTTSTMEQIVRLFGMQEGEAISFTKGAVDSLLGISTHVWLNGTITPMTPELHKRIADANDNLAQNGLRVLGLAYRQHTAGDTALEHNLTFVGMVGIIDPPRIEVKEAVHVAKEAGIRPVMITGDHPLTAYAIARDIGIVHEGDRILTGHDLSQMSKEDLEAVVEDVSVYARVTPEHKLNIVQAIQSRGHIAAMTGDGINDAPALRRSNIGVAMGITGTAVSKEASNMVITDDNFATIVSAVEEGRTIYDNARRFIKYLLASNTGELIVLLVTQLIQGMTIPLTTLQILWMNLITDGVPALALGVEQSEKGVMRRKPYDPDESLFGQGLGRHILIIGALLGLTGVALAYWSWSNDLRAANGAPAWNTMVFMFLTIAQMGHALGLRSHRESFFSLNFLGNKMLLASVVFTIIVQLLAIYTPFFNNIFGTNPLTLQQLVLCIVLSTIVFWGVELEKLAMRRGWLS